MVSLDDFRAWAVAPDLSEVELKMALDAAEEYISGAGVPENSNSALRDMAQLTLATYYLENRAPGSNGTYAAPPPGLRMMILNLRN